MRRKSFVFNLILVAAMTLTACGAQNTPDYSNWIPEHKVEDVIKHNEETVKFVYRGETDKSLYTAPEAITEMLLEGSDKTADSIYNNQLINGVCEDLSEAIDGKRTVFYVSSSEGDDANNGLSPEAPKKTLSAFSEFNSVAILLKSGDVFPMDGLFYVGTETVMGCYGEGPRPVIDFTETVEDPFVKLRVENVWAMDLSKSKYISENDVKSNLNFGQIYVDGECNFKRVVVTPEECAEYPFAEKLNEAADGAWAVDWVHGILYLYSEEDPNEKEIRVSSMQNGLSVKIANNVFLSDLEIKGAGAFAIKLQECAGVKISNCYIHDIGGSVQVGIGNRFGGGIQIQSTNSDIEIVNNYFDNIFESGISDSALSVTDKQSNIVIKNNVFTHCYNGVTQFSDEKCLISTTGFLIDNNIFYDMCDVADPDSPVYVDTKGIDVDKAAAYESYHYNSGYQFISCANLTNLCIPGELRFTNNVCWKSDRFLMRFNNDYGYPVMEGNVFYADVDSDKICLFDFRNSKSLNDTYGKSLGVQDNTELINVYKPVRGQETVYVISDDAKAYMTEAIKRMTTAE